MVALLHMLFALTCMYVCVEAIKDGNKPFAIFSGMSGLLNAYYTILCVYWNVYGV